MGLLQKLWEGIKALPGLLLPFLARARKPGQWAPWVRWLVHAILLTLVLVGLGYLNYFFDLEKVLRAPWPLLRKIWLPLLFLLIYVLGWLGWWLWQLLLPEEKASAFPDIDAAWSEARQALDRAGIDLTEAPLFLVLGRPRGTEESLFAAAQLPLQVRNVPRRPASPLHVFASRDGVYITCAGASLLGRQSLLLDEDVFEEEEKPTAQAPVDPVALAPATRSRAQSIHWQAITAAAEEAAAVETTTGAAPEPPVPPAFIRRRRSVLRNTEEVDQLTARLKHLCELLVAGRRPYCPLNGILLLVPWVATDSDADAQQAGRVCQHDLNTVRQVVRVQCPVFALVCDLELAPGFGDLVQRLPEAQTSQRLGRSFPLVPDVQVEALSAMLSGGIRWACDTLFPTLVYKLLRYDPPNEAGPGDWLDGNTRLYQLLCQFRERQSRLAALLSRAVVQADPGATLFGGCYFAATGRDAGEQAFVAGVFPLLVENQNFVRWTRDALEEDAAYRRWAGVGIVGLGVLGVALASGVYYFWPRR
jgi:hypothetical protein